MSPEYKQRERKCALWLGWHFWHKEAERWRTVAEDRTRSVEDRQHAKRRMEKAWWGMRLCKAKERWCRGDFEDYTPPSAATLLQARAPENFSLEAEELKQP